MKRPGAAPILLGLAFACLFAGERFCVSVAAPQLVRVFEVVPREIEVGDRVAVLGDGFPPGKTARVTFRGTLHRPGERPLDGSEIVLSATVATTNRLEIVFDETDQALFAGAGDRAAHTTFEGDIEVAFAPAAAGTAPIAGRLEHAIVDVRPGPTASQHEREREGERLLSWMGIRTVAAASGLIVDAVAPGSRAYAARISAGDVVTSFDGVRVASLGDVLPAPGESSATIGIRTISDGTTAASSERGTRVGPNETTRVVPLDGFRRPFPAELVDAVLIVLVALAVVLLFSAPTYPIAAGAIQRAVSRMRARVAFRMACATKSPRRHAPGSRTGAAPAGLLRFRGAAETWSLIRAAFAVARDALPPYNATALADALPCALLAAMPFGQYAVAARLDVALLFVVAASSLAAVAFVSGRTAWRGAHATAHVAWQHAPAAAAVASVVFITGSLRIQEIERAQGGWPWEWLAFRSPAGILSLGLLLASSQIDPEGDSSPAARQSKLAALTEDGTAEGRAGLRPWREAATRAHRVIVAGLASVLFLGGWLLPGVSAAEQDARPVLEIAGAVWLLTKTATLVVCMAWIRWGLPRWSMAQRSRATILWAGPLAAIAIAAAAAWTWWAPAPAAQSVVSISLVVAVGLATLALADRLRHGLVSAMGDAHLSPFL
jgi:NADH-quinone oxidoreductase subunit H